MASPKSIARAMPPSRLNCSRTDLICIFLKKMPNQVFTGEGLSSRAASRTTPGGHESAHALYGGTDGINIGASVLTIRSLAGEVASR